MEVSPIQPIVPTTWVQEQTVQHVTKTSNGDTKVTVDHYSVVLYDSKGRLTESRKVHTKEYVV